MNDVERALSEISDIRSRLAASTRFRGYAPEAVALAGLAALALVLFQLLWPRQLAQDAFGQALIWGGVLIAGSTAIGAEAIGRCRRQHGGLAQAMLFGALRVVLPVALTGVILGVAVLGFAPDAAWLLPGVWQMLIGVAAFASYASMPRSIVWPALWLVGTGALVTLFAGRDGAVSPLTAGGPIALGHLWIAWLLRGEGEHRP